MVKIYSDALALALSIWSAYPIDGTVAHCASRLSMMSLVQFLGQSIWTLNELLFCDSKTSGCGVFEQPSHGAYPLAIY